MTTLLSLLEADAMVLLAKATLILLAAFGITVLMQRATAGARHLVWLVTLAALLLLPALGAWAPLRVAVLPALDAAPATTPAAAGFRDGLAGLQAPVGVETRAAPAANGASATPATIASPSVGARALAAIRGAGLATLLFALWAVVALGIVAWLAAGALAARRIVRGATPLGGEGWTGPLLDVSDRLGLAEPPRLLASAEARMPFACGFLTPTIVLPHDCASWSLDRRYAVLLHELAHVRRRDLVGHTLGRLACAAWWFHPLTWTAAKRLRAESERACDDLAISSGARASDYAEHLLEIVTSVRRDATPAVALAMARRREFEGRMLAILDPEIPRAAPSRRQSAMLTAGLGLMAVVVGAAAPARRAAEPPRAHAAASELADTARSASIDIVAGTAQPRRERPAGTASAVAPLPAPLAAPAPMAKADPASMAPVVDAATYAESYVQRAQGRQGADTGRDERTRLLARVLATDTSATLRRVAAWGLAEHAEEDVAVRALATALAGDADVRVRDMAAWALAEGEGTVAREALETALRKDASSRVRAIAAWALADAGDRESIDVLVAALADTSRSVRARAAWAIGNLGPARAPAPLVALLRDEDPAMRKLAAWALYNIEDASTIPALDAALRDEKDTTLRLTYIRALAAMGDQSVEAIRGLLDSSDPEIRATAVRALAGGSASGPWPWPWPEPRPYP